MWYDLIQPQFLFKIIQYNPIQYDSIHCTPIFICFMALRHIFETPKQIHTTNAISQQFQNVTPLPYLYNLYPPTILYSIFYPIFKIHVSPLIIIQFQIYKQRDYIYELFLELMVNILELISTFNGHLSISTRSRNSINTLLQLYISLPQLIINYGRIAHLIQQQSYRIKCVDRCRDRDRDSYRDHHTNTREYINYRKRISMITMDVHERLSKLGYFGRALCQSIEGCYEYFRNIKLQQGNDSTQTDVEGEGELIKSREDKKYQQQIRKIIQYYQLNGLNSKYQISEKFRDNILMIEIQERINQFYKNRNTNMENISNIQILQEQINFKMGPEYKQKYQNLTCLKCNSYFIKNKLSNIYNPAVSFYPVHTYQMKSYENFIDVENNVRASICSMLNEPNGGLIFLGCKRIGTQVITEGLYITEKSKDSLMQKVESFLAKIYPQVKRNQEIFIDFVPVMEIGQPDQESKEMLKSIRGEYVCRIIVQPKNRYAVYILKSSTNQKQKMTSIFACQNSENNAIDNSIQYDFINKKFKLDFDIAKRLRKPQNCHYNTKCCLPQKGQISFIQRVAQTNPEQQICYNDAAADETRDTINILNQASNYFQNSSYPFQYEQPTSYMQKPLPISSIRNSKEPESIKPVSATGFKQIHDYKFWTLVVGDKNTMNKILQCANGKEKKMVRIEKMFDEYNFKLTKTTWVMFHDEKFQTLKKMIERYGITYKSKQVRMIASNVYIEVDNGINQIQYTQLYQILINQVGSCIKSAAFKPTNGLNNWVLWFDSLKGSIFSYFYLSDLNYKVKFIRGASYFQNIPNIQYSSYQTNY